MSLSKRIIKNFLSLLSAGFIGKILSVILYIYVADVYGATAFGQLAFATALIAFFNIFSDFGLTVIGIREISREKEKVNEYGNNILAIQLFLTLCLLLVLSIVVVFLKVDYLTKLLCIVFGLGMIPLALDTSYIFQAMEKMEYILYTKLTSNIIYLVLGIVLLFYTKSILSIPIALFIGYFVSAVQALYINRKRFNFIVNPRFLDIKVAKLFTYMSFVLFLGALFAGVYNNLDTVMLQFYKDAAQVGYYSAGYRIVNALLLLTSFISSVFFPILSSDFKNDYSEFRKHIIQFSKAMAFISLPIMTGGIIYASQIIFTLYRHSDFVQAIIPFQYLMLLIGLTGITNVLSTSIIAVNKQEHALYAVICAVIVNIILNVILIPKYAATGAAIAIVFSQAAATLYLLFLYIFTMDISFEILSAYLFRPTIGSLAMAILMLFIKNMYIGSLAGLILYLIVMYEIGGLPGKKLTINEYWGKLGLIFKKV